MVRVGIICCSCLLVGSVRLGPAGGSRDEVLVTWEPAQLSLTSQFDKAIMSQRRVHLFLCYVWSNPLYVNNEGREFYRPKAVEMLMRSGISPERAQIYSEILTIESNYDPLARSRAQALGFWQLMPATARQYGLRVTDRVDERLDFLRSTKAAARFLLDLERMFDHDPVKVLFAYNGGPRRVLQEMEEHGTANGFALNFRKNETFNFAPKVLAMYLYHKGVKPDSTGISLNETFDSNSSLSERMDKRVVQEMKPAARSNHNTPSVIKEVSL